MNPRHDEDRYGWALTTAQLLRDGKMDKVDIDNLIEEVEELARSEKSQLVSSLTVLISHLLKWQFQPSMRGHSWIYTIREQRDRIRDHLMENPGLKSSLDESVSKGYRYGVSKAARETGFEAKVFPENCLYSFEQIMNENFYPE